MATVIGKVGPTLFHGRKMGDCSKRCFLRWPRPTVRLPSPAIIRASSTATVQITPPDPKLNAEDAGTSKNILACPICYDPLIQNGEPGLTAVSTPGSTFQCGTCKKSFVTNETFIDLTVASGANVYGEPAALSTELFRIEITSNTSPGQLVGQVHAVQVFLNWSNPEKIPLVSFLYERGWRQSFSVGGFPGPEKEFEMAKDYLKPVLGGNIVDASCGSGMFSRLFAKSGLFSLVVALDFSENMLQQCYEFINQEESIPKENLILVRADIARLPFVSSSVDAVHAGAAVHCWPSPSAAVAEISRVLRPGGVFVATTFISDTINIAIPVMRIVRQYVGQYSSNHLFLSERELEDLCELCGLVGFTCVRNGTFIMFSATKPK